MTMHENGKTDGPKSTNRKELPSSETRPLPLLQRAKHEDTDVRVNESKTMPDGQELSPSVSTEAMEYWRRALADCECVPFPALPLSAEQTSADAAYEHKLAPIREGTMEAATLIYAAWALVAGRATNSKDVVFGIAAAARPAAANSGGAPGWMTASLPLRIRWASDQRVSEFLEAVRQQAKDAARFQKTNMEAIGKICAAVSMIQTQLVVQPREQNGLDKLPASELLPVRKLYAFVLEFHIDADQSSVTAFPDSSVIRPDMARKWLQQLDSVISQLQSAGPGDLISDMRMETPQDIQKIWQWNRTVPSSIDRCVHIISEQTEAQPHRPAICA